jgi:rare lipoprotein A
MVGFGGNGAFCRFARLFGAATGCLALANCAGGGLASKIDPRYGTSASARVVEPGEPVPKGGGVYRVGKPYTIGGREYVPQEDINYSAVGMASWYGDDFHGRYTANGEVFDTNSISAAHKTLPLPSYVRVTNLVNHRSIVVRVNDRGPYVGDRVIDLSVKTAQLLGFYGQGLAKVKVDYVGRAPLAGSDDLKLAGTLREGAPAAAQLMVASDKPFAPAFFDTRPMNQVAGKAPTPPDRPYRLGEGAREVPGEIEPTMASQTSARAPITEFAAAARPHADETVGRRPLEPAEAAVSPVSTYAPTRYDAPAAAFMSGRGLY